MDKVINRIKIAEHSDKDGYVNWEKIVRLNAAVKQPKEKKVSTIKNNQL